MDKNTYLEETFFRFSKGHLNFEFNIYSVFDVIMKAYSESHRKFHTIDHVFYILKRIENNESLSEDERTILVLAAFWHDVVYSPNSLNNEINSERLFRFYYSENKITQTVKRIILNTENKIIICPKDPLSTLFNIYDYGDLLTDNFQNLMITEKLIFKEFQFYNYLDYKKGRIEFLTNLMKLDWPLKKGNTTIQNYIKFIESYIPNIGVYAGSFNPFHKGHLNILEKASKIFDKVIIVRAINKSKINIKKIYELPNTVMYYEKKYLNENSLLTDFIKEHEKYANITLIRGLRNSTDFAYEQNQLKFLKDMHPDLKTIHIMCDSEFEHISSSAIRELLSLEVDTSKYIPE